MKKVWLNGLMFSALINLLILKVFFIASPPAILKNKKNDPAGENLW